MRWPLPSLLLLLALASTSVQAKPPVPAPASATKHAEELNAQAKQAFRAGQFDQAADLFMQVYDLAKLPTAVFNAARAREQAKKLPEARALLELYLKLDKTPAGIADGQAHLAAIDAAIAAQVQADADARKKADAAVAEAAKQAEAARLELERREQERVRAEKARADAERARVEGEKARQEALRRATTGLTILPPAGTTGEATEKIAREVQAAVLREAQEAAVGNVWPVTDYLRAEQARPLAGTVPHCDFRCQLEVARTMGAAYAVTTTLHQEGQELHVRLVLWQTGDATQLADLEVAGWTPAGLSARGQRAVGDLFGGIRRFVVTALPLPAGATPQDPTTVALTAEPPGALATVDELDLGPTPLTLRLAAGTHRLRVSMPGFHARAGILAVPNRPQRLAVTLPAQLPPEPAPVAPAPVVAVVPVAVAPVAVATAPTPPVETKPAAPEARTAAKPAEPAPEGKLAESGVKAATEKPAKSGEPGKSARGFVWGVVPHLEGGLAMLNNETKTMADFNWGAGGFVHMSSAADEELPVISWLVGARFQKYAGAFAPDSPPAARPSGVSIWTGVLLPRFSGLCGSLHYNHVSVQSNRPSFDYLTAQLRLMTGHGLLFYSIGAELMLKSLRPVSQYDDIQSGPVARITLEVGFNIGGTPLSK